MHVRQFLSHFLLVVQVERVVFRLPKRIMIANLLGVVHECLAHHLPDVMRAEPLPLLHEDAQLARDRKPDDGVNVVGHDHKADARRLSAAQLRLEHPKHDTLGTIVVQELATSVTGKRDEVGVQRVVVDRPGVHFA